MDREGFLIEVVLIVALILLNGFFAGAELAVVTARRGRAAGLAAQGHRGAQALLRLKSDPDRFLATVQIGVTLVGTMASAVAGVAAVERLEPAFASITGAWAEPLAEPLAVGTVVFVIAYASLVVGELMPKSLAVRNADSIALRVARPIEWLSRVTRPATNALTVSGRLLLRLIGQRLETRSPFHTLDDLRAMVTEAEEEGIIQGDLFHGAIAFQDRDVREVLTPRPRVVTIPADASLQRAAQIATDSGHTRFPVVERDLDDVRGMVYAREVFEALVRGRPATMAALVRDVSLVPGSKRAAALLQEMRTARRHLAVVVDEHGAVEGIVTLEDLLEVIVGEIDDEREAEPPRLRRLADGAWDVDGTLPVHELNSEHGFQLPESPDYVTVAGLVLAGLGSVPRGGEIVQAGGCSLRVEEVHGHRIARVRVEMPSDGPRRA